MMRALLSFIFGLSLLGVATAEEALVNVPIDRFDQAMRSAARGFDFDEFRISQTNCTADVRAVCSYEMFGNLGLMVTASKESGSVEEATIIFAKDGDGMALMLSTGIMMSVISPDLSTDERGSLMVDLLQGVRDRSDRAVTTGDVKYTMSISSVGIFVTAQQI